MIVLIYLFFLVGLSSCETYLEADGTTDTYSLIDRVFGGGKSSVEAPDCNHTEFGSHITQVFDTTLNDNVFAFHLHIKDDDDRCVKFDRQRVEIKTHDDVLSGELTGMNSFLMFFVLTYKYTLKYTHGNL